MINTELTNFILDSDIHFYDETHPFEKIMKEKFNACSNELLPRHSFFLNDIGELVNNIDQLRSCIPNASLYYKVGANPDNTLIRALHNYGVDFSVSSGPEIETLISFGVPTHSIIYSGICKLNSHIRSSAKHGVRMLSFGTLPELKNIARNYPSCDLLLRIQPYSPDHPEYTFLKASASTLDSVIELAKQARSHGMNVIGLEVALDCEIEISESLYMNLFIYLMKSCSILVSDGFNISHVYFNGGIPSPTKNLISKSKFDLSVGMIQRFSECYPQARVMVEPTDFIVDSAAQLCCSSIGIDHVTTLARQFDPLLNCLNGDVDDSLGGCFLFRRYPDSFDVNKSENSWRDEFLSDYSETSDASLCEPTCDKVYHLQGSQLLQHDVDILKFKRLGSFIVTPTATYNGFSLRDTYHMISYQKLENLGISRDLAERVFSERQTFAVKTDGI